MGRGWNPPTGELDQRVWTANPPPLPLVIYVGAMHQPVTCAIAVMADTQSNEIPSPPPDLAQQDEAWSLSAPSYITES